ncbi:hypothetical protein [Roseibium album]|uniref:hypothetical protein n=1 Tax=Roseibium album TaxID=311410 RepID=UPI00248F5725|nr:hypothetical protein [Roseibium album]
MSLVRIALRHAAVMALKDNTLAEDNVLDSEIGVLAETSDGLTVQTKERFIAVYTEEAEDKPDAQRNFHTNGLVKVAIEFGVTDAMVKEEDDPDNPGQKIRSIIPGFPYTHRGPEMYLDILGRQIRGNLESSGNEAAAIFRRLFHKIVSVTCERAGSARQDEKVAAQKLTFTIDAIDDPQFSSDVLEDSPLFDFFAMLDAGEDDDQRLANLMRAQIPADVGDFETIRRRNGLTLQELQQLGFAYVPEADEDSTIQLVEIETGGVAPVEVT